MRSTTKILSAIVFSFSAAVLGAGCNAAPVAEIATEDAAAQESAALQKVVVNDDSAIADDSAAADDEESSALAEDVDDIASAIEDPVDINPFYAPRYPSFCGRCWRSCERRLRECRIFGGGYPGRERPRCRQQFRFCVDRCDALCRRY